ncbi:2Fe-2S iron-sulfur cluster binding domain-containing protein [Massilia sp. RP-1-19]|uniref:2Fe-2S iron-sulfur cluster binding domain-containing protein n=1 Tax=Massilia polaris TaxID=2728846 RepID=A0A848HII4_9BURK|nr:2Fe-2S iron-sulfur cluster binding domain-containing protein [Massilia polaris]
MPKVTILPHPEPAPTGAEVNIRAGTSICDALLVNKIDVEHACGKVGACTTCHVIVRSGFSFPTPSTRKARKSNTPAACR